MKKLLLLVLSAAAFAGAEAQSEKFVSAMQPRVIAIDTTRTPAALEDLSNSFERIAEAEKTQWQPYYYAALAKVNAGMLQMNGLRGGIADKIDPMADKAEALLDKAEALSKDNSEIWVVRKMIASMRMIADPMSRYMTYGPKAAEALAMARKLNPENPRIYLLEGQDKFFTPEQFGGSKTEAKKLFETALEKYNGFKPADALAPNWGRPATQYFLAQASK
ncbi:hypothetical protein EPD60_03370 [Flaviaesturariibacter flavus]|uniref:Tetratricopeptide repeat protein n=1 Tax=Flaviaesturariibacter flavus TaxID=2502780 RepID=A0A4R1BMX5_9BACT|nr:hypothetical protein [Flaviaesturariibacter flavus]TCJ18814.1 hypothetical protein EPD60_03370 [Flaviaesturariibacter flavus]